MRFIILLVLASVLSLPALAQTPLSGQTVDDTFDRGRITLSHGVLTGLGVLSAPAHQTVQWVPAVGAGYQISLGFLPASDHNDRLHLSLGAMIGAGKTGGSVTVALLPGWGGYLQVPFVSLGPGAFIPLGQPGGRVAFELVGTVSVVPLLQALVAAL
jgi:hypothetical protein